MISLGYGLCVDEDGRGGRGGKIDGLLMGRGSYRVRGRGVQWHETRGVGGKPCPTRLWTVGANNRRELYRVALKLFIDSASLCVETR